MSEFGNKHLARISDGHAQRIKLLVWSWQGGVLVAVLVVAFVAQLFTPDMGASFGVSADALRAGRWWTPVTAIFVHAGLWHLWMNLSALLGICDPIRRRFGGTLRGWLAFLGLFLSTGVLAWAGFLVAHPFGSLPAVGASGALCGMWGASSRLADDGLAELRSRVVWLNLKELVRSNLLLVGLFVVLGLLSRDGGVKIAWEAHLAGFAAGLLLVGPFLRLSGASVGAEVSPAAA
jgi:membrane associated rhomboid family serine protease